MLVFRVWSKSSRAMDLERDLPIQIEIRNPRALPFRIDGSGIKEESVFYYSRSANK